MNKFKDTWAVSDLSRDVDIPEEQLKKKLGYWINQGIIKEIEKGIFSVISGSADPQGKYLLYLFI
jgi:hypothetical protein